MPATLAHRSICPSQHTVRRIEAVIQARSLNRLRKKEGRAQYYFMKHGRMEIECLHDLSWSIENCATSVRSGLFPQPAKSRRLDLLAQEYLLHPVQRTRFRNSRA